MPRVAGGSKETRNFEKCSESDEEKTLTQNFNSLTHPKLNHGDALIHSEALLNYLEQECESTHGER